jgi:hypothetical protein
MSTIKTKIKQLLQKKSFYENTLLIEHLLNNFSFITRKEYLTSCALNSSENGVSSRNYCNDEIIVSLTTYGKRLYEVYLAIESIMQQTIKPNKIVLWLGDDLKNQILPVFLQNQMKRGLEVKYCKDIRSYTKLIPSLKLFPSASIITVDDDVLYYPDLIENLINEHIKCPDLILCARMHFIKLLKNNKPDKYTKWIEGYNSFDISPLNFPTGVGGVLYPPNCFNDEVFNENVFLDICKYADDVWLKAMALFSNASSKKIFTHSKNGKDYYPNLQDTRLVDINIGKNMNDIQLSAVFDKYNLYEKLKSR